MLFWKLFLCGLYVFIIDAELIVKRYNIELIEWTDVLDINELTNNAEISRYCNNWLRNWIFIVLPIRNNPDKHKFEDIMKKCNIIHIQEPHSYVPTEYVYMYIYISK